MRVLEILKKTGQTGNSVETLRKEQTLRDAATMLSAKGIGIAVVVDEEENPIGILSERDIVAELGKHEETALDLSVGDAMTPEPVTCAPDDGVERAIEKMVAKRCRHLPVLEGGKAVGVISARDIMIYMVESASEQERARIFAMVALA